MNYRYTVRRPISDPNDAARKHRGCTVMPLLYTEVSSCDFHDCFTRSNRALTFSYAAQAALYKYLVQLADDTNTPIELDIVQLCSEWTEYPSAVEAASDCGYVCHYDDGDDDEEEAMEWLNNRTQIITFAGGILTLDF